VAALCEADCIFSNYASGFSLLSLSGYELGGILARTLS
jgi:hypothetical protein